MYSHEATAQRTLLVLGGGGLGLCVLGLLLAMSQWPDDSDVYEDTGSAGIAYLGLAISGIGQLAVLVALIGFGVGLGIRWSGLADTASDTARSARTVAEVSDPSTVRSGWSKITPLGPTSD